jgi:hypothetical protein
VCKRVISPWKMEPLHICVRKFKHPLGYPFDELCDFLITVTDIAVRYSLVIGCVRME